MDRRPLLLATAVALLSCGLLAVAVYAGWLGPDQGRGDSFCEVSGGLMRQPVNALSNLGFVLAGLLIARRAGIPALTIQAHPGLAVVYSVVVVLLGPASAAMHATQSALGGHLDMLSMYLVASFAASYALMRLARGGVGTFAGSFAAMLAGCLLAEQASAAVPVVDTVGNLTFAALLTFAVVGEVVLWRRRETSIAMAWGVLAVGSLVLAFAIWNLSRTGRPWCDPTSLLQGHGAWHLLCALAAYALFRLWASERARTPLDGTPDSRLATSR